MFVIIGFEHILAVVQVADTIAQLHNCLLSITLDQAWDSSSTNTTSTASAFPRTCPNQALITISSLTTYSGTPIALAHHDGVQRFNRSGADA
jgi:hypothetical protein